MGSTTRLLHGILMTNSYKYFVATRFAETIRASIPDDITFSFDEHVLGVTVSVPRLYSRFTTYEAPRWGSRSHSRDERVVIRFLEAVQRLFVSSGLQGRWQFSTAQIECRTMGNFVEACYIGIQPSRLEFPPVPTSSSSPAPPR